MKNSEKKIKYIDIRDAAGNLALSQHQLVRELLKLEIKIWVGFDEISSRMVKIVPPINHQKFIDYRINPGEYHCLTLDSSKRIERMLEKSELVFKGLRLEIGFGGYPLTLQIFEDDPGMRIFVNQKDLDLISKLPNKIGPLGNQHSKTQEDLYLSEAQSIDEFVPIEVAADQKKCIWQTMVYKTIEDERKIFVRIHTWAEVYAVKFSDYEGWIDPNEIQPRVEEKLYGFDSGLFYLEPVYQREFYNVPPPWEPFLFYCPSELIKKLRRLPEPEEKLYVRCSGKKYNEKSLFIKKIEEEKPKLFPKSDLIDDKTNEKPSNKILDKMDQLLIQIQKNNPEWTAGQVWNELGREVMRRKRVYDKEEILFNYRDDKKDTLLWNSGRGKYKQSSLGLNTLRNRITELRKAGLIE
ncbi:MAG: hypothetical protein VX208_07340 [SAR324 cluster bacterium]|jgi:hypothetical protein|nr:hypothetical protein [SAR324 cluster bacterium]